MKRGILVLSLFLLVISGCIQFSFTEDDILECMTNYQEYCSEFDLNNDGFVNIFDAVLFTSGSYSSFGSNLKDLFESESTRDGEVVSMSIQNIDISAGTLEIYIESTEDIAGFQFSLDNEGQTKGVYLSSASGGIATASGFLFSTGCQGECIAAFSLSGDSISTSSMPGVLVELTYSDHYGGEVCFKEGEGVNGPYNIISDSSASELSAAWIDGCGGEVITGCTDSSACNYNADATNDDSSCEYAEENYDCGGNCITEIDCAGVCSGDAEYDCNGDCGGTAVEDECGVCEGSGAPCETCIAQNGYVGYEGTECQEHTHGYWGDDCGYEGSWWGAPSCEDDEIWHYAYPKVKGCAENGMTGFYDCTPIDCETVCNFGGGDNSNFCGYHEDVIVTIQPPNQQVDMCLPHLCCIEEGCDNPDACNYEPNGNHACDGMFCDYSCYGCLDFNACNYNSDATVDDGSCWYVEEGHTCSGELACTVPYPLSPENSCLCWGNCDSNYCHYAIGDINGDGGWNVGDIMPLVSCVTPELCGNYDWACAGDLDQDGGWTVIDIVKLAGCILTESCKDAYLLDSAFS